MLRTLKATLVALPLLFPLGANAEELVVGSWNVKRLGSDPQQSYQALAAVASKMDLIALQEVMTTQGLDRLELALETATNTPWERLESHLIGSRQYKEAYAFLYRPEKVRYEDGAVVYLDRQNVFFREPYSARFRTAGGTSFVVANIHVIYGNSTEERAREVSSLADYWDWLAEVYPREERILVGDFNLPPSHPAWDKLKQSAVPLITRGATTIGQTDNKYASLYDNIWVARGTKLGIKRSGVVRYPQMLKISHQVARERVSDHAPVFALIGGQGAAGQPVAQNQVFAAPERMKQVGSALASSNWNGKNTAGPVRGNSRTLRYHAPGCPSYESISSKNRVEFDSSTSAVKAGYSLAGNCQP
jgi:endonuclease/exonuclease/phosphatase family metal-dependent hydrolase